MKESRLCMARYWKAIWSLQFCRAHCTVVPLVWRRGQKYF